MKTVLVDASKQYDVHIGSGLLESAGSLISEVCAPCTAAIITDDIVDGLYSDELIHSLSDAGYSVNKYVFPNGEGSKNLGTLGAILEAAASDGLTRSDLIIALGGGVVGDIAGFAASCYLRGLPYVQIPTTLLAAIDSSVGGKTAVDLTAGKNLVGAFHQPELVICDTDTLLALPDAVFSDGVAEAIKYGVIASPPLFRKLKLGGAKLDIEDTIFECVSIKADIVAQDEFDFGLRQLLNFGHTIGHAIEKCSNFSITHGHAVAIGMASAAKAALRSGLGKDDCATPILAALKNCFLPHSTSIPAKDLAEAAMSDKKRRGGTITLVLPQEIGHCILHKMPVDELEDFICLGLEEQWI